MAAAHTEARAINPRFQLGRLMMTAAVRNWLVEDEARIAALSRHVGRLVARHAAGDWGETGPEDSAANERAIAHGDRVFSVYDTGEADHPRVWVITEADRSSMCVLFPEDY